jgi:hypothetical protein
MIGSEQRLSISTVSAYPEPLRDRRCIAPLLLLSLPTSDMTIQEQKGGWTAVEEDN